jgi:CHASE1-domain containing sensor protein
MATETVKTGALRQVWQFLTRPHPTITDIEQRRQSRLLAGLIIALLAMSLVASFMLVWRNSQITASVIFLWLAMLLTSG